MRSWKQFWENYERTRKHFDEKNFRKSVVFAVLVGAVMGVSTFFLLEKVFHLPERSWQRWLAHICTQSLSIVFVLRWTNKRWPSYKKPSTDEGGGGSGS